MLIHYPMQFPWLHNYIIYSYSVRATDNDIISVILITVLSVLVIGFTLYSWLYNILVRTV